MKTPLLKYVTLFACVQACATTGPKVSEVSKDGAELTLHLSVDQTSLIGKMPEREARRAREALLNKKSMSNAMLLSVAELSVLTGQYESAEKEARSQLKGNTKQVGPYKTLAKVSLLQNRPAETILITKNGLTLATHDPDLLALQGVAHFMLEDFMSARECWRQALKYDPQHIPSLMNMGVLYFHNKSISLAGRSFEKVLQQQPKHVDAQLGKALVLSQQGQAEDARVILKSIVEKFPKNHLVIFNLAMIERERFRNPEESLHWVEKYISLAKVDRTLMERALTIRQELREEVARVKNNKVTDADIRSLAKEKTRPDNPEKTTAPTASDSTVVRRKQAAVPQAEAAKNVTPAVKLESAPKPETDDIKTLEESLK